MPGSPPARYRRAAPLALVAMLALAPAAWAGRPVALKAELSSGASITLGDLFDGAGAEANATVGTGAPAGQSAVLDASIVQSLARQHGLDWDNSDALVRIIVPRATTSGHMSETLAWARSIQAGELIQPEDLTYAKVASFAVPADAPRDADQIIGKVARRPLRGGAAVGVHDVSAAQVIKAGDSVEVIYADDGVRLVLGGKALGSAAVGETVDVMNPVSKKTIQAIASAPDEAVVGPTAEALRAHSPLAAAQLAALH